MILAQVGNHAVDSADFTWHLPGGGVAFETPVALEIRRQPVQRCLAPRDASLPVTEGFCLWLAPYWCLSALGEQSALDQSTSTIQKTLPCKHSTPLGAVSSPLVRGGFTGALTTLSANTPYHHPNSANGRTLESFISPCKAVSNGKNHAMFAGNSRGSSLAVSRF